MCGSIGENVSEASDVTVLLHRARQGDKDSLDRLLPLVYGELRRVAENQLRGERAGHTLQPTALVHEAYLRLIGQHSVDWNNRAHFFSIAAETMRRILVNHAVERRAQKRGSGETLLALDELNGVGGESSIDLILLDEALVTLAELDRQQAKVIELRFFGGLTIAEVAEVLNVSEATVNREWRSAKAWVMAQLS